MEFEIDGRQYGTEQFILLLEKLGIGRVNLEMTAEGKARGANSLVDELKNQFF